MNYITPDIDACPLCGHDEYFMSQDGEKFICGRCGFHTTQLSKIKQTMLTTSASGDDREHQVHQLSSTRH